MRELFFYPPNYKELNEKFKIRGKPVIFAWGNILYNPSKVKLTPELLAHEAAHGERQLAVIPDTWWRKYCDSSTFRLEEELIGHKAEYAKARENMQGGQLDAYLKLIAMRLSSPLYGKMIDMNQALKLITK